LFKFFYSLGGEEILIFIEPAEDLPAGVHKLELFAVAVFNLYGDFIIFQG